MKMVLVLITALLLPALAQESPQDEWLGIGGLRIVDVHHTEGYLAGVANLSGENGTEWLEPALPGQTSAEVAGVWTIFLADQETRRLDLTLYQADGEVFGEGTMTSQSRTWVATGAGYVTSSILDLSVVTLGDPALIRLRLNLAASPFVGSYAVYRPSGLSESGTASGYRTVAMGSFSRPAQTVEVPPSDLTSSFAAGLGAV
jgi:hypothetical protein